MTRPTFEQAKARYVHRFTMEHIPSWADRNPFKTVAGVAHFYAPHYRTDREWYDAATFPGEKGISPHAGHCQASNPTWPLGETLPEPYFDLAKRKEDLVFYGRHGMLPEEAAARIIRPKETT